MKSCDYGKDRSMTATIPTLHGTPARFTGGMIEVAPKTWAWLQPNGDWSESNAGLIAGAGTAALIDTAWDLPLTRRILDAAGRATSAPIEKLIVTHADGDHLYGCQLLPNAEMIASADAVKEIKEENPRGMQLSHLGCRLLRTLGIGAQRRFGAYVAKMFDPFDFRGITIRMPDTTFRGQMDLDIGGRTIELRHLGPAHTAGDVIVRVPDVETIFVGDLVFRGVTPNSWSGPVAGWRRALDEIMRLKPHIIVPGHGPVTDIAGVAELDRYWSWLEAHALRLFSAGHSIDETAELIVLGDGFAAEPWGSWVCPERTVLNIVLIDRARRGVPTAISHSERPRMMWRVAKLHAKLKSRQSIP
jgi:cyclase